MGKKRQRRLQCGQPSFQNTSQNTERDSDYQLDFSLTTKNETGKKIGMDNDAFVYALNTCAHTYFFKRAWFIRCIAWNIAAR